MINELKLKGNELIVYAIIYGFSQDGQSQFYGSYRYVARALSITERSVQSVISKLLEKGLIIRVSESHYMVEKTSIEKTSPNVEKTSTGGRKNFLLGVEETTPNIYNTNNKNNNKKIDLPDWLNKKVWSDWVEYRKEMKKPLTPMGMKKQIKFLEANMSDHVKILNKSMVQGWVGIFKLDNKTSSNDAVRAIEKIKSDRERQSYQEQLSKDNENARRINEMLKTITSDKTI